MSEPFLSELKCMSFGFAPKGWALCNGQLMPINQNQALFSLLGTTYGGDGMRTFGLPNLQGRTPIHMGSSTGGSNHTLGEMGGEQAHTLNISEIPTHIHFANAGSSVTSNAPTGNFVAGGGAAIFTGFANAVAMNPAMIGNVGGSQPHLNMQPFLVLNWCIALQGIFPSQT